jgi:hypothetical protein
MARDEHPPFTRGETYYNGSPIDTTNLGGVNLEGKEYRFEVNSPDGYAQNDPSGRLIHVRIVRNTSGANLVPSKIAVFDLSDPTECKVNGYSFAVGDRPAGIIDEFLPAAGVPPNDLFYLVVEGPSKVLTVNAALTALAIGDKVVPGTGTGLLTADAGKIQKQDLTGVTAALANNIQHVVGYSEQVQAATNTLTKINVKRAHK